jgi:glycosyltransferase involved in cell wall biosynthesis
MKARRIVAVLPGLSRGSVPRLTLDALEGIKGETSVRLVSWGGGLHIDAARRLGPTVVLRDAGIARVLPRGLATEHVVQAIAGGSARLRARRQGAALRRWKPDLVYVSSVTALPLVRMMRLEDVPVVVQVHELGSGLAWFEREFPGMIRSLPDRYAAVSNAVAHDLIASYGVPEELVSVVSPYALPPLPAPRVTTERGDRKPIIVGGSGWPSWTKGIDLWLLAVREAVDRLGPDRIKGVWVGYVDNQAGLQFRTMISKLGLDGVVELVPVTDQVYEEFARFDMFAMSSWEESASMVVLEAMTMGIPVICFAPTGGPGEEVAGAGIVIPEISPRRMADAIVDLAESAEKRRAFGNAGAERVRGHFSREKSLAELTRVCDLALTAVPHGA